jgi:hypothetical protein
MGKVKNKKKTQIETSQEDQIVHKVQVVDKSTLLARAYRDQ